MSERHNARLVAGEDSDGTQDGPPAAEHDAAAIRKNLMSADPVATPDPGNAPATDQGIAPETTHHESDPDSTGGRFLEPSRTEDFMRRWETVKASFVDDPHTAVKHAEELTDETINELTAVMETHRRDLAERWENSGADHKIETERLRTLMQAYQNIMELCLRS